MHLKDCIQHSKKDIALNNCVTISIVESVINELSFDRPTTLPQTLCIDEFKGSSGIWNPYRRRWEKDRFHCNISNGDNGSVIDILPRMDKPYLTEYFRQFPLSERQKVLFVTCDMHGGYISLAKDMFPNVTICVDMFHVIRLLNSKIDSIRNALHKELLSKDDEETYKTLKNSRRMLLTAEDNQETYWKWKLEHRKERIEELLQLSPDLREAYEALQSFHQIVRTEKYSTQRVALTEWIQKYCSSEVPEVRSAANTIKFHRSYILNSFKYQKSNGPCEGLNNKIKVLKRNAYGFHSFEEFRKRILLTCGNTHLVKETYTLKDRKGAARS